MYNGGMSRTYTSRKPILVIGPSISYIALTKNQWSIIDSESLSVVGGMTWYCHGGHGSLYATRSIKVNRECRLYRMHHFLICVPSGMVVDHKNGNSLDNRLCNLRVCTQAENMRNLHFREPRKSGYLGVSWNKRNKVYQARIRVNGKSFHLGTGSDPKALGDLYEAKRKEVINGITNF